MKPIEAPATLFCRSRSGPAWIHGELRDWLLAEPGTGGRGADGGAFADEVKGAGAREGLVEKPVLKAYPEPIGRVLIDPLLGFGFRLEPAPLFRWTITPIDEHVPS